MNTLQVKTLPPMIDLDLFLAAACTQKVKCSVFMVNGVKLEGYISAITFEAGQGPVNGFLLSIARQNVPGGEHHNSTQLVRLAAVATVLPTKDLGLVPEMEFNQ